MIVAGDLIVLHFCTTWFPDQDSPLWGTSHNAVSWKTENGISLNYKFLFAFMSLLKFRFLYIICSCDLFWIDFFNVSDLRFSLL
jgi:hypothetical protein